MTANNVAGAEAKFRNSTYLNERQLCERLHIRPRTAQRWRMTGSGPAWIRLGARKVLYHEAEIEKFSADNTFRHRADESMKIVAVKP